MINISTVFQQLVQQAENVDVADVYKLKVINFMDPYILIGLDLVTGEKRLYVDVTDEAWTQEQLTAFPRWKGLSITREYFERLGPLEDKEFLIISQGVEQSDEIFEKVIQSLVDHILLDDDENLFSSIYNVLDLWHNFFKSNNKKRLSEEEQMGLFGELYYLLTYLEKHQSDPPFIVDYWKGTEKSRIDFIKNQIGVEVKTRSPKLRSEIRISNETQLEINEAVNEIYLYVLEVEKVNGTGQTIQDLIDLIREKIQNNTSSLLHFNDMLLSILVYDNVYNDVLFLIHSEEAYQVTEAFPKLTKENLSLGIYNLSYTIDLSHCIDFKIDVQNVYSLK